MPRCLQRAEFSEVCRSMGPVIHMNFYSEKSSVFLTLVKLLLTKNTCKCEQICKQEVGSCRFGYLSRDNGLGSGRMAAIERGGCLMGEGMEKFKSKEPVFLCSGSISIAPCISLSMGHEPALPWLEREDSSGPIAPCSIPSTTDRGSCVGDIDGGDRDFFFVEAPARSFKSPLFFSFCI